MQRIIEIVPYNPLWPEMYRQEAVQIQKQLGTILRAIHHIGSTSIPGMTAKPVIDILAVVNSLEGFEDRLIALGYTPMGESGLPRRRFFIKEHEGMRICNLHCFEAENPEIGRHLRFRDYLISHPEDALRYAKLKNTLAKMHPHDILEYLKGKYFMILEIDRRAAEFADSQILSAPEKKDWTPSEIATAMEDNWNLSMTLWPKYLPTMEIVPQPGDVQVVTCPTVPDSTFNYVLRSRFTLENALGRISEISSEFREKKLPFSWYVGPGDTPQRLPYLLEQKGFSLVDENFGMYLELENAQFVSETPLAFKRVVSSDDLKAFDEVNIKSGESPHFEVIYRHLPPLVYQEGSPIELYIGYLDDKPVTTGILVLYAGVVGIYYIATIPEERRKGYAKAMMEHLFARAKECGYRIATLQATADGLKLYEKLGFQACCCFREYYQS